MDTSPPAVARDVDAARQYLIDNDVRAHFNVAPDASPETKDALIVLVATVHQRMSAEEGFLASGGDDDVMSRK